MANWEGNSWPPGPIPMTDRPPEHSAIVAAALAISAGWRSWIAAMPVASRTEVVRVAMRACAAYTSRRK